MVDSQLEDPTADRLAVAEVPDTDPGNPNQHSGLRAPVGQRSKPLTEDIRSVRKAISSDFHVRDNCNLYITMCQR